MNLFNVIFIDLVRKKDGGFVGGGVKKRVEYNFLLICVLLAILFPNGMGRKKDQLKQE